MPDETKNSTSDAPLDRYSRQMRFQPLGAEGQRRLAAGAALVCGVGALGSVIAELLARAGVGRLRIVDRDFIELSNLQRQLLYDEDDVASGAPKAIAAAAKLRRINSTIEIEPVVADVTHENILALCEGVDVIVDGLDNFETRLLINDASRKLGIPWVYGGCLGAEGQVMVIIPGETAGFEALVPDVPPPGATPTCDSVGVLGPAVAVVAAIEANEAIKLLAGAREAVNRDLIVIDLWENQIRQIKTAGLSTASPDDPGFPWLEGRRGSQAVVLCGRDAVMLRPSPGAAAVSLPALADKLRDAGATDVAVNRFLVKCSTPGGGLTVFADGRTIVSGVEDAAAARALQARWIGG